MVTGDDWCEEMIFWELGLGKVPQRKDSIWKGGLDVRM